MMNLTILYIFNTVLFVQLSQPPSRSFRMLALKTGVNSYLGEVALLLSCSTSLRHPSPASLGQLSLSVYLRTYK